jgi:hypothetical protein
VGCSRAHPRESDLKRESQRVTAPRHPPAPGHYGTSAVDADPSALGAPLVAELVAGEPAQSRIGWRAGVYDFQLTRYDAGWRATFYTTGMQHSPTSATGTAWERTPWHATQRRRGEALNRSEGKSGW